MLLLSLDESNEMRFSLLSCWLFPPIQRNVVLMAAFWVMLIVNKVGLISSAQNIQMRERSPYMFPCCDVEELLLIAFIDLNRTCVLCQEEHLVWGSCQ